MNKATKTAIVILGVATVFVAGTYAGANSDWASNAVNQANVDLGRAGYSKKTELVNSASQDINAKITEEIGQTVDEKEIELQKLLDDYYKLKLEGLTTSQKYLDLEKQIKVLQTQIFERYRKDIDAIFSSQQ